MKRHLRLWVAALLCGAILICTLGQAQAATSSKPAKPASAGPSVGLEAAKSISTITGVAISPLLGVGVVGAYHWWKASPEQRPRLAWYAQPWFWAPALALVILVGLKDVLGTAAPTALKKPFDAAEAVENKISGLIAAGAFVPLIFTIFPAAPGNGSGGSDLASMGFAAINGSSIGNALLVPFAIAAFALVWLAGHAINMLILLSPFTTLDTALKSFRLFLLSSVALTSFINPYVGAAVCCVLIVISYFIAGWTFRLSVTGTIFAWDFLSFRRHRYSPRMDESWMFTARKIKDTPIRTYGKITREDNGKLVLDYRPWLVLPRRRLELPEGDYAVGRGLFYPEIGPMENDSLKPVLMLPPRYNGHEEEVAKKHRIEKVVDVGLRKGLKAGWRWLKGLFGAKSLAPSPELLITEPATR